MASPITLIKEANKAYPGSNIVWIAIALASAVALISAFQLGVDTLVAGGIVILVSIVLFTAVAMFHKALNSIEAIPGANILAGVIAWAFTLLIIGFFLGMFTAFFFGVPQTLERLFRLAPLIEVEASVGADEQAPSFGTVIPDGPLGPGPDTDAPTGDNREEIRTLSDCLDAIEPALAIAEFQRQVEVCRQQAEVVQ
jgi:hypothetical protein